MSVGDRTSREPAASEFAAWVQPHLPAMARLAARLVAPLARDDVVQESLLRAWRRHSTYDPSKGSELGWLLAIVGDQGEAAAARVRRRCLSTRLREPFSTVQVRSTWSMRSRS
jgi:DNA-directed RNA polymerase specialized sigma24 family protein